MSLIAAAIAAGVSAVMGAANAGMSASAANQAATDQQQAQIDESRAQQEQNAKDAALAARGPEMQKYPDTYQSVYAYGGNLMRGNPSCPNPGQGPGNGPRDGSGPGTGPQNGTGPNAGGPGCPYAFGGDVTSYHMNQMLACGGNTRTPRRTNYGDGGLLASMIPSAFDKPDMYSADSGGTHQENPYGGIPVAPGKTIEEGEFKYGGFVFTDRF